MKIIKYTSELKKYWDNFILTAKNGHFFFYRDYMEYHADRFKDYSHIIYDDKNNIVALLPLNVDEDAKMLYSHQGLTFGGFIVDDKMTTQNMLDIFEMVLQYFRQKGYEKLYYKCIPHIYHLKPSEEDRYALFRISANLERRDVSSTIDLTKPIKYSKGRKWSINKAKKEGLEIELSNDYSSFWKLLEEVLKLNHATKAVHSLDEILELANKFPHNIKLYTCQRNSKLLSGALIYENQEIVHTQYLANSSEGRDIGALDLLIDYLINQVYFEKRYFDFGISNEEQGRILNTGLISQKEGFGARPVVHDFYMVNLL